LLQNFQNSIQPISFLYLPNMILTHCRAKEALVICLTTLYLELQRKTLHNTVQ
jgi:hypothetical protein